MMTQGIPYQGSEKVLVRSYLGVSHAAGLVNILIFLLKIKFSPCLPINFVMQGKCLFSDISRPAYVLWIHIVMMALGIHCWCLSISLLNRMYPGYTLL